MKLHITDKCHLLMQGKIIPSIKDNPVNYLGKWYDKVLRDNHTHSTEGEAKLKSTEKSGYLGKCKTWLYQQGLLVADESV